MNKFRLLPNDYKRRARDIAAAILEPRYEHKIKQIPIVGMGADLAATILLLYSESRHC